MNEDNNPAASQPSDEFQLETYDAGLLNDYGGGKVEWWQDYIRSELSRAHDFYQSQCEPAASQPSPRVTEGMVRLQEELAAEAVNIAERLSAIRSQIAAAQPPAASQPGGASSVPVKDSYTFEEVCTIEGEAFMRGRNVRLKYQPPAASQPSDEQILALLPQYLGGAGVLHVYRSDALRFARAVLALAAVQGKK